jgi:hypothetical protein
MKGAFLLDMLSFNPYIIIARYELKKGDDLVAKEWVVERLISVLPMIGDLKKDKRELADNALSSISTALTETCINVNRWKNIGKRNEDTEAQLARYWSAAAIPLRHIDQELSEICEYKSEYWVDLRNWDPSKTNGIAIDIESVREKYRARLHLNYTNQPFQRKPQLRGSR